ncbi:SGNH/GDSL hydrolase family protein [Actinokineospora iranica]|uniref:GDSL-like Lipase/Acylhydrolase family protein n=1 Tax=Actinokineospora iranica TaxID=1271860 RepID=A0A1G6M8P1_9PSEU|nr:SGNH/GDSL hydrolase family protein [Actinokineospora iranica]SDC51928.1 GDSL-like Lipase/Acylhydrolase family protein [Actinokineospora iranica]
MRFTRAMALAVAAAASGGLIAAAALPASAAGGRYVALGDSYAAGTGAGSYGSSGTCVRSAKAHPQLWANAHPDVPSKIVTCAGATTANVLNSQVSALTADTTMVTISIGGNDVDFAGVMTTCTTGSDSQCVSKVNQSAANAETALPAKLDNTYAEIKKRSPNARVIVLGYPRIFASGQVSCSISLAKRTALNDAADKLNTIIADRVRRAGFVFEDVRDEFAGHGVCSAAPWIKGVNFFNLVESYHPNATGQAKGYYQALTKAAG